MADEANEKAEKNTQNNWYTFLADFEQPDFFWPTFRWPIWLHLAYFFLAESTNADPLAYSSSLPEEEGAEIQEQGVGAPVFTAPVVGEPAELVPKASPSGKAVHVSVYLGNKLKEELNGVIYRESIKKGKAVKISPLATNLIKIGFNNCGGAEGLGDLVASSSKDGGRMAQGASLRIQEDDFVKYNQALIEYNKNSISQLSLTTFFRLLCANEIKCYN
jgi:hypothetical protein